MNRMNQRNKIITVYLFAASLIISWCHNIWAGEGPGPQRVISLAPSVTETLFALGFGNRVVGVTTYCDYPPEARRLPKIGGFTNPSVEAIVATRPDLVIGISDSSHPVKTKELEQLGIKVALISVGSLDEILNSFKSVARMEDLSFASAAPESWAHAA